MHPLFLLEGVEHPTKFSKEGPLTGPQFLEGAAGKGRGEFSRGGVQFFDKKIESEIFNDKKVYKEEFFVLL